MVNIRLHIETWFEGFARRAYRHPLKTVVLILIVNVSLGAQLPKLAIDSSIEGLLQPDDPELKSYNAFRDQFGRDEVVIIAVHSQRIFDQYFLRKLKALHSDLELNVPFVRKTISLLNARATRSENGQLIVEKLFEKWPQNQHELDAMQARAMANPLYRNLLISEDGTFTAIILRIQDNINPLSPDELLTFFDEDTSEKPHGTSSPPSLKPPKLAKVQYDAIVQAAQEAVRRHQGTDFEIYLAGLPVVNNCIRVTIIKEIRLFLGLTTATVALLLLLLFRRLCAVWIPLLIVGLSLVSTFGIMAAAGVSIKAFTHILPSFLLSVGICDAVHILAVFFHYYPQRQADKAEAIAFAFKHSAMAVLLTSLTTSMGFFSFATAELSAVADIGLYAGLGVLITLIYTLALLPSLLSLVSLSASCPVERDRHHEIMDRFIHWAYRFSTRHPRKIVVFSSLATVICSLGLARINVSYDPIGWLPETNKVRLDTEVIDRKMGGTLALEVVIDSGQTNGLYNPDLLNRIDQAANEIEKMRFGGFYVGKAWSLPVVLKETHQALNDDLQQFYSVPSSREQVAQELLLFENAAAEDLEYFTDSQFSKARMTAKVPFVDGMMAGRLLDMGDKFFNRRFPNEKIEFTGLVTVLATTFYKAIRSMIRSYLIALAVITVLMIVALGRIRLGLVSMIPNLVPIIICLGLVGALSIPMDMFSLMVGSIAIGLVVDDTIHFMHNFERYRDMTGNPTRAVFLTLDTTGRAMLTTSVALSLGFLNFYLATLQNLKMFGLIACVAIVLAFVADILLAPALMVLLHPSRTEMSHL